MEQYISKSALVAEIERRRDAALTRQKNLESIGQETVLNEMVANELNRILSFINTIEVKEVDLEKEIDDIFQKYKNGYNGLLICKKSDFSVIAKYFFELGMQQSKNYNNNEE